MQNRESGHEVQGRDRSAHHVFRSSMSDPVYYTRSSMSDPSYPGPQRGMVTPQVNVAEGMTPTPLMPGSVYIMIQVVHKACQGFSASDGMLPGGKVLSPVQDRYIAVLTE